MAAKAVHKEFEHDRRYPGSTRKNTRQLRDVNVPSGILSNGTPRMLDIALKSTGIHRCRALAPESI
jgi:hypothetical protein